MEVAIAFIPRARALAARVCLGRAISGKPLEVRTRHVHLGPARSEHRFAGIEAVIAIDVQQQSPVLVPKGLRGVAHEGDVAPLDQLGEILTSLFSGALR
jgi:hypothetical protein